MSDKEKLRRMQSWTIAVFATIFAVVMAVMWLIYYRVTKGSPFNVIESILGTIWYAILPVAVLCIGAYFGYSFYLSRRK